MWNSDLDTELVQLRKRGLSFSEISAEMGITRGAALGRFNRLKGKVFPSQVAREQEIADARRRRKAARLERQRRLVKKMGADIAAGKDRNRAIKEAYEAGATVRAIAQVIGLTAARVHQIAIAMGAQR